jgi:diguanylate cyclase (GGDEF)-like protein
MSYPGSLSIPLHLGERQLGVLTLIMAPQAVFSGDEINLLQTIGDQYSAAVERAGLFENAEHLATVDALTGLIVRRHFFQTAQKEFERTKRYGHPVTIAMLDIDFFKYVNDKFGHLIGDYVLQQVAERCKSVLRSSDMIGRYGGEEFVILLPETDLEKAKRIADRIRQLVMNRPIVTERGDVNLTVSIGLACLEPGSNNNLEQILDLADQALYRAKDLGRNRIQTWQESNANPNLLPLD